MSQSVQPFQFSSHVNAILKEIRTVREVREICREDGLLEHDMMDFLHYFRCELRRLAPEFSSWRSPTVKRYDDHGIASAYLEIAADESWGTAGVAFGLAVRLDPTAHDPESYAPDQDPYVYVRLPESWSAYPEITRTIKRRKPDGFTDEYPPGDPEPTVPIWRYLRLDGFTGESGFDTEAFVTAVAKGFADLLPLQMVIDQTIQKHPLQEKQRALPKQATARRRR